MPIFVFTEILKQRIAPGCEGTQLFNRLHVADSMEHLLRAKHRPRYFLYIFLFILQQSSWKWVILLNIDSDRLSTLSKITVTVRGKDGFPGQPHCRPSHVPGALWGN